jgi:hypothetical protein
MSIKCHVFYLESTTNNNGNARRRFLNVFRFTASRPSVAVRFTRQYNTSTTTNSCQMLKQKSYPLISSSSSSPIHDNNSITSS